MGRTTKEKVPVLTEIAEKTPQAGYKIEHYGGEPSGAVGRLNCYFGEGIDTYINNNIKEVRK